MAIYPVCQSESKLWIDQWTRDGAKRLHPTKWENLNAVNNMYRMWSRNKKKKTLSTLILLTDQIFCASLVFKGIAIKNTHADAASTVRVTQMASKLLISGTFISGFIIWSVFWGVEFLVCLTWKLSSQCVCVSILKLQIRRLHWALRRTRTKTHISTYIIIWHCTQQITDVLSTPHANRHSNILYAIHVFFFNTYHYSVLHTAPTHTLQARSQFRLIVCLLGVLIGCWISRQRWLAVYIFFLSDLLI